ncbi:MAG: response regulator [Pseudomonadota bacterium]
MSPEHLSILVVDDNAFTRKLVRSMLRQVPVSEIVDLDNAEDALALIRTRHFDAVLMDWFMPDMGGEAFLLSVGGMRGPGWLAPPVMIMTAHAKRRVVLKAARLGAHAVLAKPLSVAILRSRIFGVLNDPATGDRHDGTEPAGAGPESVPLDVDLDPGQILL